MTFWQYLLVLKARYKLVLYTMLATVGLTMLVSLLMPKTYTATAGVLIDVKGSDTLAGTALGASMPPQVLQGYMATQIEVITSEKATRKVVKALRLEEDEELREKWLKATKERVSFEEWLSDGLRKNLEVKPSRDSNVINIAYSGKDAKQVAAVANAFSQAYLETDLDLKVEPAKQSHAWFDERTKAIRQRLDQAQGRLSAYQKERGIIATDEKVDIETARLNELSTQLTMVQGLAAESQSKSTTGGVLPEVVQSPLIQTLKTDLARQSAKLNEMSGQLGPNHPQYQRMEAEVRSLRDRLNAEMGQIAGSVGTSNRVTQQREAQIRAALEAQKEKVLKLKQQREESSGMLRELETAKKEYEVVTQRLSQTRLESLLGQTNLTVLNPAVVPLLPSVPKLQLNLILSIFFGTVFGVAAAFLLEQSDRRIRDPDDMAEVIDLPVLAVVSSGSSGTPGLVTLPGSDNNLPRLPGANASAAG